MTVDNQINISARWDKNLVPAGRSSQRNLLLEITAPPKPELTSSRPAINLALVIDRSGSMNGTRIEAARAAAAGIVDALEARDRLSLVIFDNEIETLVDSMAMDAGGKREAKSLIGRVQARSSTNLGAGWFEGARCVARLVDSGEFAQGHVLVLSDGRANDGICDPRQLLEHARELAERGVKTSAVGIGENYAPLQLDALAEGGSGRLHDAGTPEDIVEIVLGELGELHAVTARDVVVKVECPRDVRLEMMTRSRVHRVAHVYRVKLGDIVAGSSRPLAIRVDVPACEQGELLPFDITVDWRRALDRQTHQREGLETVLRVVPPRESDAQQADLDVVEPMSTIVEAVLAYQAMGRNERHDYVGASRVYVENCAYYEGLVNELPDASERLERLARASERVSRQWEGRSKRQAFALSKKAMLFERDLRSREPGAWHDHLDDQK